VRHSEEVPPVGLYAEAFTGGLRGVLRFKGGVLGVDLGSLGPVFHLGGGHGSFLPNGERDMQPSCHDRMGSNPSGTPGGSRRVLRKMWWSKFREQRYFRPTRGEVLASRLLRGGNSDFEPELY